MPAILVTGAHGQIGSDLVPELRKRFGKVEIVATDIAPAAGTDGVHFETLDVTDRAALRDVLARYEVDTVYHMAGVLSATGERDPDRCWAVNVGGLRNVLEAARDRGLRVFWPSSIAVFGPHTPKIDTPQTTVEDPSTMYGVTKVTGEMLCNYYARHFGVDVRSVRLPGIISHTTPPGGGTTDFAVDIFYAALRQGRYTSFVRPDTRLPMMYMPDCIDAILQLMKVDASCLTVRTSYNITAVSFSAEELAEALRRRVPGFTCTYQPDFRQAIADTWPQTIDDARARADWGWRHRYDLEALVDDMLAHLAPRLAAEPSSGKLHSVPES